MYRSFEQRLARLLETRQSGLIQESKIGLEKECLRVARNGGIAQTLHPSALGSALTNPYITTDYSEALLEFITPPFADPCDSLHFLRDAQKFVYDELRDEILWPTSMPCVLAGEASIPIAQYGHSNAGMMKTVYRRGLGYRYGKMMQVIAGVHFNYSLPDGLWPLLQEMNGDRRALREFTDDSYFRLIRNLQRVGWIIPYLFGASPAICKSFLAGHPTRLAAFDDNTYYEPFATSLRMGDIGYQNNKEALVGIKASYDSLEAYVRSLTCAIETLSPDYEKIGVVVAGEYRQLNANILQIENEYYSTVRPKQLLIGNEKPTLALKARGVRYIELRSLDVNAFDPLGVNEAQLRFLEALMLFCLLHDSPPIGAEEAKAIDHNQSLAAHRGREPDLRLSRDGRTVLLRDWAGEICDAMEGVCELLDEAVSGAPYVAALRLQQEAARDPERTPSARMLAEMRERKESFYHFAKRMSEQHQRYFQALSLAPERRAFFRAEAQGSLARQAELEATDSVSFEEYLRRYFAQTLDTAVA